MKPVAALLLLVLAACSSTAYAPTILVTNSTCNPGPCTGLHIYGHPVNEPVLAPEQFVADLGVVTSASACLTFPHSGTFSVVGATVYTWTWTVADPFELWGNSPFVPDWSTGTFVPQDAPGWRVTLPGSGLVPVAMDRACTP